MSKLWTVMDLMERWDMSAASVERTVRDLGVPFVELRARRSRVSWENLRFRPSAVEAWEERRQTVHPSFRKATEKPAGARPPRPAEFKHLGRY